MCFNWRLIILQYCGGFCHTLIWISHRCTCPEVHMCSPSWTFLPPPSIPHPSELSQCTSFECPVSCIKLGLVICFTYGNIHVSMLFSQIISPWPSPTESKSVLYIDVSFAVCHMGLSLPFSNFHIYTLIYCEWSRSVVSYSLWAHGV